MQVFLKGKNCQQLAFPSLVRLWLYFRRCTTQKARRVKFYQHKFAAGCKSL